MESLLEQAKAIKARSKSMEITEELAALGIAWAKGEVSIIQKMNHVTGKVLMYMNGFIDERMLVQGIYATSTPKIRPLSDTIESIVLLWEGSGVNKKTIENLKRCYLGDVAIIEIK